MELKLIPRLVACAFIGMASISGAYAATEHAHGSSSSVQYRPDVTYTLRTDIADGKLVFVGEAGDIKGKVNPQLNVREGAVVQINLVNGDGATHDISVPDFATKSNQLNAKGASTAVVFRANKKGEFQYICSLPGHVQAGMIGKIVVGDGQVKAAPKGADISRSPLEVGQPVG